MANDTLRRWFNRHILLWLILTASVYWWRGPALRLALEPNCYPPGSGLFQPDFFQEWASARNLSNRLPIYAPHEITLKRHVGIRPDTADRYFIAVNAHPPTSVLLALPFTGSDYTDALPFGMLSRCWSWPLAPGLSCRNWTCLFLFGICCPLPSSFYQGRGE